jgi:hypothetical protein
MRLSQNVEILAFVNVVVVVVEIVTVGLGFGLAFVRKIACTRNSVRISTMRIKTKNLLKLRRRT